jgi:hypothetical protein
MRDDDDTPRRRKPVAKSSSGMPVWGWLAIAGLVVFGGMLLVCGGCVALVSRITPSPADVIEASATPTRFGESAKFGPLSVQVKSARLSTYSGTSPAGHEVVSSSSGVLIALQTSTTDATKEHAAKGAISSATLKDQFGNSLSTMRLKTDFGFTCEINGQLKGGSSYTVRSDRPLGDLLVFDEPVPAASTLILTVDAANYGGKGELKFEIPESEWKPKKK